MFWHMFSHLLISDRILFYLIQTQADISPIPTGSVENLQNIIGLNRYTFYFPAIEIKRVVVSLTSVEASGSVVVKNALIRGCFEAGLFIRLQVLFFVKRRWRFGFKLKKKMKQNLFHYFAVKSKMKVVTHS